MKRRDTFRLIPLSFAGAAAAAAQEFDPATGMRVPPPPPGPEPLSMRYTRKVRELLGRIRATQSENMLEASYAIARAVMEGRTCWSRWDMGHSTSQDIIPDRVGNPAIFRDGFDEQAAARGDLFLVNIWGGDHQVLVDKDIFVIGGPAPWGGDAGRQDLIVRESAEFKVRPYAKIWIETFVDTIGAIIKLPGMPAPVGPSSGIIGMVTYWMMLADTCRILAREGYPVQVYGDEPVLGDVERESLHEPLMDRYFEIFMNQSEMIGAERGHLMDAAKQAVDAVLTGRRVWAYSRESAALSSEASTRRGGLAMTSGIHDVGGNLSAVPEKGDVVYMGLYRPDDPVDMRHFETIRKAGAFIVSLGPMTRNTVIQQGETIPKMADIHVGRMCDTYGLFALPGFERKVCPTSGALVNQMWWAGCMEIAEEMIRRTGNTPGVFWSAAIKDGTEHMNRMHQWYQERGY